MESKLSDERRTRENQGVKSLLKHRSNIHHHVIRKAGNRRKNKFTSSDVIEILLWQMGWYQLILTDRGYLCIALYRL